MSKKVYLHTVDSCAAADTQRCKAHQKEVAANPLRILGHTSEKQLSTVTALLTEGLIDQATAVDLRRRIKRGGK